MEVPDTALTTYGNAEASTSTLAIQRELNDRSFDVGDEGDFDIEEALKIVKDGDGLSDDIQDTVATTISGQEEADNAAEARMEARLDAMQRDAFSDEIADAMIDELKEIGMFKFIQKYVVLQAVPLPKLLMVFGIVVPPSDEPEDSLYLLRILKITISRCLRNRERLPQHSSPDDAVRLIQSSKRIVVLTGAGISTNCGIPDFRSPQGIYARLQASGKYPELTDPQEMFDIEIFKDNPEIFYSFAHELYPTDDIRRTSRTHRFIRRLELEGKLLRNYTQNIDTLEKTAGIQEVLHAHGSFATASCLICKAKFPGDSIKEYIYTQTVPMCPLCIASAAEQTAPSAKKRRINPFGGQNDDESETEDYVNPWKDKPIVKPDITFFGQALDDSFDKCLIADREELDLLIVIGTSLQVAPVSELLSHIPHRIPQILINRDPVPHVMDSVDIALLGDCDEVVAWIESQLEALKHPLAAKTVSTTPQYEGAANSRDIKPLPNTSAVSASSPTTIETLANGSGEIVTATSPKVSSILLAEAALPVVTSSPEIAVDGVDHIWFFSGANREHRWFDRVRAFLAEGEDDNATSDGDEDEGDHEGLHNDGVLAQENKGDEVLVAPQGPQTSQTAP